MEIYSVYRQLKAFMERLSLRNFYSDCFLFRISLIWIPFYDVRLLINIKHISSKSCFVWIVSCVGWWSYQSREACTSAYFIYKTWIKEVFVFTIIDWMLLRIFAPVFETFKKYQRSVIETECFFRSLRVCLIRTTRLAVPPLVFLCQQ